MNTPWKESLRLNLSILAVALHLLIPTHALYFYLDGSSGSPKCFYEELPKDTMVVGM